MKLRAERVRIAFLLLAPLALMLAVWLLPRVDPNARLGFAYDRQGFIDLASRQAAAMGRPVDGWPVGVDVKQLDDVARFLRLRERTEPAAVAQVRRISHPVWIDIRFISLDATPDAHVFLAPDGAFQGATLEPEELEGRQEPESEATANLPVEQLAETHLREWLGEELYALAEREEEEPSPEEGTEEEGSEEAPETAPEEVPEETRSGTFQWKLVLPELPELTLTPRITVKEGRITGWQVSSSLDASAVEASVERGEGSLALRVVAGALLFLLAAAMLPRGLWRYWLRFQESEVSHSRTILLGLLVAGMAATSLVFLLLGSEAAEVSNEFFSGTTSLVVAGLVAAATMLPVGLLLGAAWAGTEGDVREIFPAKLVSLDAVLGGRWWSRNPSRALLQGAAAACWACLAHTLVLGFWALRPETGPDLMPFRFLLNHPWQFTIAISLLLLIPYSSLGFLGLLSLLRSWTRSRWRTVLPVFVVLWLSCLLLPWVTMQIPMTAGLLLAAVWAGAFLVPFYVFDLLTAFLSFLQASLFLQVLLFLAQPSPALRASAALPMTLLGGLLLLAALVLRFGRDVAAREVRPGYAHNMLERAALSAELSAALQARTRLLPDHPPELPRGTFSVSAVGEEEAEGEYYDFFPLADGRMAFALADFGRQGLAAALRMTLAKGHLMSYSRRELPPGEAVSRLERRLDELVTEPGSIALVYGLFDPATGFLQLAGGRGAPWVLVRSHDGEVREISAGDPEGKASPGHGWDQAWTLEDGDAVAFLALGDPPSPAGRKRFLRAVAGHKDGLAALDLRQMLRNKGLPSGTVVVLSVGEGTS